MHQHAPTHKHNNRFQPAPLARAISTALLLGSTALSVQAADEAASKDPQAEIITVTAQGREQRIQDVPYNISSVSGDDIEAGQISDAAELMRNIPGVAVVDRGPRNSGVINGIMIRGLNVDSAALGDYQVGTVPTVSTYVNNTPLYANFILKDIQRVEVLRGPQGTLYGSGSLGGTVRYLMREPELGETGGKVSALYSVTDGSDGNNWSTDAVLNLGGDSVAFRVSAGMVDYAGITDYANLYRLDSNGTPIAPGGDPTVDNSADPDAYYRKNDADTYEVQYFRASLLWQATENFRALFAVQHQEDDVGGRRQVTRNSNGFGERYGDYENGSVQLEPSSREVDLMSLELEIDLGFATLTSSTSEYEHTGDSTSENTGFYAQNNWLANFYYNYPRPMASALRSYSDEGFIQELRLVSDSGGKVDWLAGLYYAEQDLHSSQESLLRGFMAWADAAWGPGAVVSDRDFYYDRKQSVTDQAFFGELTFHASDDLHLSVGWRLFENEFDDVSTAEVGLYTSFNIVQDIPPYSADDAGSLYKFNVAYDLSDNAMLYFTASEGYRRGGTNPIATEGNFAESENWLSFAPDTVTNMELGLKGGNSDFSYTLALFTVEWNDIQLNTATTNWAFYAVQNGGDATTQGLELQLEGSFGDGFRYGIGYAYVDATLDNDVYNPDGVFVAAAGNTLPGTPEHSLNLSLSHTRYLDDGLALISRIGAYYQSETENVVSDSVRFAETLDAFTLIDGSLALAGDNWDVALYAKNLTNEDGVTGVFKEEYMGTSPAQNYYGNGSKEFITVPFTIGIAASFSF